MCKPKAKEPSSPRSMDKKIRKICLPESSTNTPDETDDDDDTVQGEEMNDENDKNKPFQSDDNEHREREDSLANEQTDESKPKALDIDNCITRQNLEFHEYCRLNNKLKV